MTRAKLVLTAGVLAGAATVALTVTMLASSAQAQSPRRPGAEDRTRITEVDENGRVRTRLTVRRRSFLDPGSEVSTAFQDHYHDYAVPPGGIGTGFYDRNNYDANFSRAPLLAPFDTKAFRDF